MKRYVPGNPIFPALSQKNRPLIRIFLADGARLLGNFPRPKGPLPASYLATSGTDDPANAPAYKKTALSGGFFGGWSEIRTRERLLDPYTLSRRAPSTARPSIRKCINDGNIPDNKTKNKSILIKNYIFLPP